MDHFNAVGALGLGSRFKRLSETLMTEVKAIYTLEGAEFEPRWFPLFSYLSHRSTTTVSEAAQALQITHPHISLLAKELELHKLISFEANANDGRSRIIKLTRKGRDLSHKLAPMWKDIKTATEKLLQDVEPDLISTLDRLERQLEKFPHAKRIVQEKRLRIMSEINVIAYTAKYKKAFAALNKEWIEEIFELEPHDHRYFSNPEKEIIKKGGAIIFAEHCGNVVGTCSLLHESGTYELAKLAVTKTYKGLGLGEKLCKEIIAMARSKGEKTLTLTTNTRLQPAIQLYKKLGFVEKVRGQHPKYKRVDLVMELELS